MADTAVVDVDGTLVDSNYQHALAWFRAFRAHELTIPLWRLHRAIGMGGDQLVGAVAGPDVEQRLGDEIRARWAEEFDPMLDEIAAFEGASELLAELRERGLTVVLASSGKPQHVDRYLDLIDGRKLAHAWTTSEDVEQTKPAPDLLHVAMERAGGGDPVVIGDSVWDLAAAERAGYPGYGLRTGGFGGQELLDAGARAVYETLPELREALDEVLAVSAASS